MTDISALEVYAGQLSEAAALATTSAQTQRQIVNGDELTDVSTESGPVPTLAKQAVLAQAKVTASLAEVASQMAGAMTYATTALGLAGTNNDGYFSVPSPEAKEYLILYQNVAGVAVEKDRYSNAAAVKEVRERLSDSLAVLLAVVDDTGYTGFVVTPSSIKTPDLELSTQRLVMGDQSLDRSDDAALMVIDEQGFVGFQLDNDGLQKGVELPSSVFTAEDIVRANQAGLASSAGVVREYNTEVARAIWDYNHFIEYGQSLSTGYEGWPALSKVPKLGNLMWGNSVRPASRINGAFVPLGAPALTPLKAIVQDGSSGAGTLTDAQVAALSPGSGNEGETSVIGMTNFAKTLHNQRFQVANDARSFVASCCGVNGQTIEQLTKGDVSNRWLRLTEAAAQVKAAVGALGKTYGIAGVSFLQGEFNYTNAQGGDTTLAGYKAKLASLYNDIETDVVVAGAGQGQPPLFITYQAGASYTNDANNLAIGMAQWELSQERRNWVLATPVYPYPDKGGHLTSNSYRWIGKQFAKVWHRVVELGQDWKPLSPLSAVIRERDALITFHVPHPPLVFDTPYVLRTATDYASKGFSALDSAGALGISSVALAADCVVRLVFSRAPVGPVFIRYADKTTHNGNGCLRDSDPTVSDDLYEYTAGSGQYADENIAALVGKPYPLHNWCIAFHIPAVGAA